MRDLPTSEHSRIKNDGKLLEWWYVSEKIQRDDLVLILEET